MRPGQYDTEAAQQEDTGYVAPMQPQYQDPMTMTENLRYMLDSSTLLEDVERMMRGLEYDPGKKAWVETHKAMANPEGVRNIMARLRMADREIKLSNFDSSIITKNMNVLIRDLACDIHLRCEEWGIDTLDCSFISYFIVSIVYAAYCRGDNAHEKVFLRAAQYGVFSAPAMNAMYQEQRKPWYQKLNPFSK